MCINKVFAVDFDGTLCEENYPNIGKPFIDRINYLIRLRKEGNKLILWTCRCGKRLDEAVEWCKKHGLEFDAINENLPERIEQYGGDCRKLSVDYYIDDRNIDLSTLDTIVNISKRMWKSCNT